MISPPRYPGTIAAPVQHELIIKKSRFLTYAFPLVAPEDADGLIAATRKRHWDANHNCLALVTGVSGEHARSSDDGEPSGTAGAPILDVLRRRDLTDVLVIVTRYFGGVKLGAGGLVRAYSSAASEALDRASLVRREVLTQATLAVGHADAGRIDHLLRDWAARHDARLGETDYAHATTFEIWVAPHLVETFTADIAAASGGELVPRYGAQRIVDVPA